MAKNNNINMNDNSYEIREKFKFAGRESGEENRWTQSFVIFYLRSMIFQK